MKNICPTHHFSFTGKSCPFCEKERIDMLSKRFCKEEKKSVKVTTEKEITENDLLKLTDKFNRKKR